MSQEAMRLALEALQEVYWSSRSAKHDEAITCLREALAEQPAQPQEPVAVVSGYYGGQCVILPIDPARIFNSNTPLYTAPQPCPTCEALARTVMLDQTSHDAQRKPLTDEQIESLWDHGMYVHCSGITALRAITRAIEAAHGIGEKK